MLVGRRYRLELNPAQAAYAQRVGDICRAVWNAGLEQRRAAAQLNRGRTADRCAWPSYASQGHELAEAKRTEPWLAEAPGHCLQQTLRDLDRACRQHGVWRVRWRSKHRSVPSFRFPDPADIGEPRQLGRRWGAVKLPKLGVVGFRWSRPLGGTIRNATVVRDGQRWYVTFCVEDGHAEPAPNGLLTIIPSADYPARLQVVTAGSDLPDIIHVVGTVASLIGSQFVQAQCSDLTPFLAGDAARDYPNLAAILGYAYRGAGGVFDNRLYGVPIHRYLPAFWFFRNTHIWDAEIGADLVPKDAEVFKKVLQQLNRPQESRWAIRNTGPNGMTMWGLISFLEMFGAPNMWMLDPSGKLIRDRETDQFKAPSATYAS